MTLSDLLSILGEAPLIASVQAGEGSPVDDPDTLLRLAQASLAEGVRVLRLQGVQNICRIKDATEAPVIGLIKRTYPNSDVYITPTLKEIDELLDTGCEVIALDATPRPRSGGARLEDLIRRIQGAGRLAMADCDDFDSVRLGLSCGADIVGTTLSGYTPGRSLGTGPDLDLLRQIRATVPAAPVLAEGRYDEPWQARAALRIGASAVVVGGALNDPIKQTRKFVAATATRSIPVGAVDIGGTWLRAGLVSQDGAATEVERVPLPRSRLERNAWINDWIQRREVREVGIGAGGTIDPQSGEVIFSKPIIPDHVGTIFGRDIHAERVVALNDGHATAWAHAMHPSLAGLRVATLALGTGVGFGLVDRGRILMGRQGEHPRINDTPTKTGKIFDELLGGAAITENPTSDQIAAAIEAAEEAVRLLYTLYYPDAIVIAGGISLQPWMDIELLRRAAGTAHLIQSQYGANAGLIGAGFLVLFPPSY